MRFEGFSTENKRISKCIPTTADTVITDILKPQSERASMLGLGLNTDGIIPVFFCGLIGSPAEENLASYKNALFTLREDLPFTEVSDIYSRCNDRTNCSGKSIF